jgi:saccharopine dehydrogenase (NAD+, L-lysine-forming)
VSTAFHSTGVPEIVTYTQVPGGDAASRVQALAAPVSRLPGVRRVLDAVVARRVSGPDEQRRAGSSSQVWARAETDDGRSVTGVLSTPNGYALTADSVVRVAERVLAGDVDPGAHTPSRAHGPRFVLELDGVTLHRLDDAPG